VAFGGDDLVVDLDEERADEPETHWPSGPCTHEGRVVLLHRLRQLGFTLLNRATSRPRPMRASSLSRGRVIWPTGSPGTTIGRTLALVTERVDPSQQRRSLEAEQ
jgi:hypothetical protein